MTLEPTKLIGYCNDCGKPVFATDFLRVITETNRAGVEQYSIYKCIKCNKKVRDDDLIPF